jgi:hypothetical protein
MRFTAIFLATLASTVVAQGHDMASMGISPAATAAAPAGAAAPAAPAPTAPAAAAGGAPKGEGKKGAARDDDDKKSKAYVINQINDGQLQANPSAPSPVPEGTSKTTVVNKTTHTVKKTATASQPAQQTKNAGSILNAGSGLGLLGLVAAIIA